MEVVDLFVKELGSAMEPRIVSSTPNVFSAGMRCVKQGCSLVWPSGERPYFDLFDGRVVALEVVRNTPYPKP
eukprot:10152572-Lingulodinium_polyedra.AAC.1